MHSAHSLNSTPPSQVFFCWLLVDVGKVPCLVGLDEFKQLNQLGDENRQVLLLHAALSEQLWQFDVQSGQRMCRCIRIVSCLNYAQNQDWLTVPHAKYTRFQGACDVAIMRVMASCGRARAGWSRCSE